MTLWQAARILRLRASARWLGSLVYMALFPSRRLLPDLLPRADAHPRLARLRVLLSAAGDRHGHGGVAFWASTSPRLLVAGGTVIFAGVYLTERG